MLMLNGSTDHGVDELATTFTLMNNRHRRENRRGKYTIYEIT